MGETFYSVLGVSQDADTATIKEAYREKVKTHHPDVSDESDAAEQFQRITEARDVLVDDGDRKRYDRLGHDAYVRRHLDSTAWTASESSDRTRRGNSNGGGRRDAGASGGGADTGGSDGRRSGGRRRGRGDRTRNRGSRSAGTDDDASDRSTNRSRKRRATGAETGAGSGPGAADGGPTDRAAWMGEDGWSTSESGPAAGGSARNRRRTRGTEWQKQHAASNVYSPTGRDGAVGAGGEGSRFATLARGVGPWIVFHFVFLVSAFVTMYLLLSWSPTVPTMFGSLLLLGTAIFFSILHMVSRIYS